jgi:Tol biopolymer transport system component
VTLDTRARRAANEFRRAAEGWKGLAPGFARFERFDRFRRIRQRNARVRAIVVAVALAAVAVFFEAHAIPRADRPAAPPARNGRIAFVRFDPQSNEPVAFSIDPDGTDEAQMFFSGFFSGHSEWPHWSPDGGRVSVFCCDDPAAAHIVNPDTGAFNELPPMEPRRLEEACGFAWSPDGRLLACGNFGLTNPRDTGVWTIRASDGGGLTQLTSNRDGEDDPGDFSPDGKHLVFLRKDETGRPTGLFVVGIDGGGLLRITPKGMNVDPSDHGSWSPTGNQILLVAQSDRQHRRAIWEVNADGSGLHQLRISPACGGPVSDPRSTGCGYPGWSPDGTKIVYTRLSANGTSNIEIANADGSDVTRVTQTGDAGEPDWGTHPITR